MTPLVRAVQQAMPAVVNIQGQKTVSESIDNRREASRQVNGMGTGVVIDSRGYVLTNHHVVDGVRQIRVTFADGETQIARLVAFDKRTDLAVIKVNPSTSLPVIRIGTSSDLLPAEEVVAVGNAYGYENTVTVGIISALHRDVQVSETQAYDDLIQTDASINPGNSGGPLLNIEGDMIGVNVAVRAGAQGIGFAIPVDAAMEVASRLMSLEELEQKWHGLVVGPSEEGERLVVKSVLADSPAEECGLRPGDVIERVGKIAAHRPLDLERGLLDLHGQAADVQLRRDGQPYVIALAPMRIPSTTARTKQRSPERLKDDRVWDLLGMSLQPAPPGSFSQNRAGYDAGLWVDQVRPASPAAQQGIRPGDILVGIHSWKTATLRDVEYIVAPGRLPQSGEFKLYIMRNDEVLFGRIDVASLEATQQASSVRR